MQLAIILSTWNQYYELRRSIVELGFTLPIGYRDIIASLADCSPTSVDEFWAESAREYVSSGGGTKSELRQFHGNGGYRSPVLDRMAQTYTLDDARCVRPLLEGLRRYWRWGSMDRDIALRIKSRVQEIKDRELHENVVEARDWSDSRKAQRDNLLALSKNMGFCIVGDHSEYRKGMISASVSIDLDGNAAGTVQPDLEIWHERDGPEHFAPLILHRVVPGLEYYLAYRDGRDALRGLNAYLSCTRLFVDSIADIAEART